MMSTHTDGTVMGTRASCAYDDNRPEMLHSKMNLLFWNYDELGAQWGNRGQT